jgi:hypothetical protein
MHSFFNDPPMPKLSRRLILFCTALLILALLPLVALGYAVARNVLLPPVPGTHFVSYDGVRMDASCTDYALLNGGHTLVCNGFFHFDSRFAVVNHSSTAVAWCVGLSDQRHFGIQTGRQIGPLVVGAYPTIPGDWPNCAEMLPIRTGIFARITINY